MAGHPGCRRPPDRLEQADGHCFPGDFPRRTSRYYADAPNDYRNINAGFVARFASRSKAELLSELNASLQAFEQYILSLDENLLTDSHAVNHYSGRQATVGGIIASLTGDYQHHQQQIREWLHRQDLSSR